MINELYAIMLKHKLHINIYVQDELHIIFTIFNIVTGKEYNSRLTTTDMYFDDPYGEVKNRVETVFDDLGIDKTPLLELEERRIQELRLPKGDIKPASHNV
ncbi:hypothetical protein [Dasania marina]|uniref:hypothetical protein n=1 Tax=Dasania marina TaxID=471499 RepID=UPI0030DA05BE